MMCKILGRVDKNRQADTACAFRKLFATLDPGATIFSVIDFKVFLTGNIWVFTKYEFCECGLYRPRAGLCTS